MNLQDLQNIQANILKSHGRNHVLCLFIRFNSDAIINRNWIKQFSSKVTSANGQREGNRYFQEQLLKEEQRDKDFDKKMLTCFFLSAKGYRKLGYSENELPKDSSFRLGMKNGLVNGRLADMPSGYWEPYFRQNIDAMILLANDYEEELAKEHMNLLRSLMQSNAGVILFADKGSTIPYSPRSDRYVEHFGFIDGISNPEFKFDDKGNLIEGDPAVVCESDENGDYRGSYLVFRKLEQNVLAFNQQVKELAEEFGIDKEYVEAQVIGRFKDGTPLEKSYKANGKRDVEFNFEGDPEGSRCPFHSHIRKVHPRVTFDTGNRADNQPLNPDKLRIVRRGITYGSRAKDLSDEPEKGVGLLFMCYQNSIQKQFEHIQKEWCNNKNFFSPDFAEDRVTGIDPIIGQKVTGIQTQKWNTSWLDPATSSSRNLRRVSRNSKSSPSNNAEVPDRRSFQDVVTLKGGEYFYAPSIAFLKNPPMPAPLPARVAQVQAVSYFQNPSFGYPFDTGDIFYYPR